MSWVMVIGCVGLAGILVEMWLSYFREVAAVEAEGDEAHAQIRAHAAEVARFEEELEATTQRVNLLQQEQADLKRSVDRMRTELVQAEEQAKRRRPTRHRLDRHDLEDTA